MLNHCVKRFPLVSFPRYSRCASTAALAERSSTKVVTETSEDAPVKKRVRAKKPNEPKEPKPPSILEWTKLQDHLDSLAQTNGQVALADIERHRPKSRPQPGSSKQYRDEYDAILKKLIASFNARQLREFLKMYEIPRFASRRKMDCAIAILEYWTWPSLSSIREAERELETDVQTFPVTPPQAFLILGKGGADLHALKNQYHIRMTYSTNPSAFEVEGTVGSLKKLSQHIADLKNAITEDVFELPVERPIRNDLLRRISELSGAFAENFGPRTVRVSFKSDNPRSALVAKRLATRAVCEGNDTKQRLFFHLPPSLPSSSPVPISTSPYIYSLYPFLSPRSLPWTVSASGVFRLRRVEEWLGSGVSEDLKKTGGLELGRGRTVTLQQQEVDLRTLLLAGFSEMSPPVSRVVIASIGHLLITSPPNERFTIAPPLQGHLKLPRVLDWMGERSEPAVFTPTLPTALLDSRPAQHGILHRLLYHAVNVKDDLDVAQKTIKVELVLPSSVKLPDASNESSEIGKPAFHPMCWLGQKTNLDVLMPNRPTDIRFSLFDSSIVPGDQLPPILEEYISSLRAFLTYQDRNASQPETPLMVEHEGVSYALHSSSTVRQSTEQVEGTDSWSVEVITESALDLEGGQKSTSCQVTCNNILSNDSWKSFMHQCDAMSTVAAPDTKSTTPLI
ncbi:hypothetical protein DFH07DRAFT_908990 [Mycena maculata]|uniref:SLS1 N-terminal domain-containing protein n=1 Tax=Mycena maculata TaxID=230809 RepID=A0AAD7KEP7_9AGAR|nr:hypothetical protein DFH07DRAFT_908990 [Mycena maculata]